MNTISIYKKAIIPFLLLLISLSTQAQTALSGRIIGENDQVLSGATVQIKELKKSTSSDSNGEFTLNVSNGSYEIEVSFMGYKTIQKQVITNDNYLVFQLFTEASLLNEVLVSATRATEKTPVTFNNVTKEELASRNLGQDLPILLDQLPSVVTTSDAGAGVGYTGIRVRGSDATRVNVTINGIPYNDAESQGTFWVNMPDFSSSVEDIQLQRGVGTSTNGSGAFGASLNIQTLKPTKESYATTSHSIGSFNTRKHNINVSTGIKNDFYATARLSKIESDGYIDRSSADLESYFLEAGYITDKTKLQAIVFGGHEITQQAWYGTPEAVINEDKAGIDLFLSHESFSFSDEQIANLESNPGRTYNHYVYENEVDNYEQKHYQLHLSQQLYDFYTLNISGNYTVGEGFFEQFKPKEEVGDYFPNSVNSDEEGEVIRRRWLSNDFLALVYSLNYKKEKLNATIGGGTNIYRGDHFGNIIWDSFPTEQIDYQKQYYFSDAQKTEYNAYIKAEYELSKSIYAFADLQYRIVNHKSFGTSSDLVNINLDTQYDFFNPKAGLTYSINNNNSIYASFAVANREPNRDDLTKNPVTPKAENLQDLEVGYKFKNNTSSVTANVYYMNYKDQLVLTGEIDDVGDAIRQNVDESYRLGLELQASHSLSKKVKIAANATFSQNRIKEFDYIVYDTQYNVDTFETVSYEAITTTFKDTDISFSPSIIANGIFTYSPILNLNLSWISKYVGDQFLDNTSSENKKIDAYLVNNINASYKFNPKWIQEVSVNLLVNNILSEEYSSNGYTYSYFFRPEGSNDPAITEKFFYPQALRNFLLGVTLKF